MPWNATRFLFRIVTAKNHSTVDVVICEMLHSAMLREKQLAVIHSFKQRYQAKFGDRLPGFIPTATRLFVQPVEQSFVFDGAIDFVRGHSVTGSSQGRLTNGEINRRQELPHRKSSPTHGE
jgi:predicted RNA methylase